MSMQETIKAQIKSNPVVLYMKGTKDFPQCGFSGRVVNILRECGVDFLDVNVLEDPEMRQGIKDFSSWPTVPQLYVNGQFVGGCDIVVDLYERDKLQTLFNS